MRDCVSGIWFGALGSEDPPLPTPTVIGEITAFTPAGFLRLRVPVRMVTGPVKVFAARPPRARVPVDASMTPIPPGPDSTPFISGNPPFDTRRVEFSTPSPFTFP